jgi:hypothetical protein
VGDETGRRIAAVTAAIAGVLVFVHSITWDIVRYRDGSFVADISDLVKVGAPKAALFRVSLLCDMLGSYLLLVPAVFVLRGIVARRSQLVADVTAAAGVAYGVVGGVTAAVYAIAGESLIRDYASAPTAAAATSFGVLTDGAIAAWQIVGAFTGGVWLLGVAWAVTSSARWYGRFTAAFGAILILFGAVRMLGVSFDTDAPATPAFALIGILGLWTAWFLWRDPHNVRG